MSDRQIDIAECFHNLKWDTIIDFALNDKCAG